MFLNTLYQPETEDLCMHLPLEFGIEVAKQGLVKLKEAHLSYLTKQEDNVC